MSGIQLPHPSPDVLGDQVLLSGWTDADAAAVLEIADDPASRQWSRSMRHVHTLDDAREWMAVRTGPGRVDWAIRDPATRQAIGRVALMRFRDGPATAEVGYGVHPAHRRRGVAVAAVTAAVGYATEALGLHRLELIHSVGNVASCAVATRSGFGYEGTERSSMDHEDGPPHDMHRHARLATDPAGPADPAPEPVHVPVLAQDGLRLRPWSAVDAEVYVRGLTDPEVARWSPGRPPVSTEDAVRRIDRYARRAAEGTAVAWAVEVDGAVAGAVSVRSINRIDDHASVAYWVLPEMRGHGVATRALSAVAEHALTILGLHRLQLQHALGNTASCRVAEKAGFVLESTQRESCRLAEGYVDEHQHVRLAAGP